MFDGIKLIRRKYISISEVISLAYTSAISHLLPQPSWVDYTLPAIVEEGRGGQMQPTDPIPFRSLPGRNILFDSWDGHVLIHIPMVPKGTLPRLFWLHPFLLPMFDTHHLMLDTHYDVLAISSTKTWYNVQLSSTDLLSCHRINQIFMCSSFGVMSKKGLMILVSGLCICKSLN